MLTLSLGIQRDASGKVLPDGSPSLAPSPPPNNDYSPYNDWLSFELADLLYRRNAMPGTQLNDLLQLWAARHEGDAPFSNANDLYSVIEDTTVGNVLSWQSFTVKYNGELGEGPIPPWKLTEYEVFFRDPRELLHMQLANPDFRGKMDFAPKRVFDDVKDRQRFSDFMSGNWCWCEAVRVNSILCSSLT